MSIVPIISSSKNLLTSGEAESACLVAVGHLSCRKDILRPKISVRGLYGLIRLRLISVSSCGTAAGTNWSSRAWPNHLLVNDLGIILLQKLVLKR